VSKAKAFLITGMPRCRAAWLSVLCTTGSSLCYYGPSREFQNVRDVAALYASDFYKNIGIADSDLSFALPWLLETIKPRTVLLDRDAAEVEADEMIGGSPREAREKIQQFRNHPLVMFVPFEALELKRVIQKIFWHLMPGESFDEVRFEQLEKMRIDSRLRQAA
jgi:hypothetical protein